MFLALTMVPAAAAEDRNFRNKLFSAILAVIFMINGLNKLIKFCYIKFITLDKLRAAKK